MITVQAFTVVLLTLQAFTVVIEAFLNRASDENFFQMDDFLKSQGLSQAFKKIFDKIDTIINDLKSQAWSKPFVVSKCRDKYYFISINFYIIFY